MGDPFARKVVVHQYTAAVRIALKTLLIQPGESLESYLNGRVFAGVKGVTLQPDANDAAGFAAFMRQYESGLAAERAAVESL